MLDDATRQLGELQYALFDYFQRTGNDAPYREFGDRCRRMATRIVVDRDSYREAAEAAYREADRCVDKALVRSRI